VGNSAIKRAGYLKRFEPVLKPLGYAFDPCGLPVECIVRVLPANRGYLVYLGNWDGKQAARPVVSLPALKGTPGIEVYSSARKTLSDAVAPTLTTLAVELAPAEVKLLRIVSN
jgi:hypothetical protein